MRLMGLEALAPKPDTSRPAPEHRISVPATHLEISSGNQVWAADITYIPMARGFVYLVAIIDWYSRLVLSWRLSNTMDTSFCVDALDEALTRFGTPEIFNTDQGAQFTAEDSPACSSARASHQHGRQGPLPATTSSSSGCGARSSTRRSTCTPTRRVEARAGIGRYFGFFNDERPHQALGYQTPNGFYRTLQPTAA